MKPIITILLLLFSIISFAQEVKLQETPKDTWILYKNGDISIYYKVKNCTIASSWSQERVLFKFVNNTNNPQTIKYKVNPTFSSTNEYDAVVFTLALSPNETIEGKDVFLEKPELYLFSKSTDQRVPIDSHLIRFSIELK